MLTCDDLIARKESLSETDLENAQDPSLFSALISQTRTQTNRLGSMAKIGKKWIEERKSLLSQPGKKVRLISFRSLLIVFDFLRLFAESTADSRSSSFGY